MSETIIEKRVWVEDDATPGTDGHEGWPAAYRRIVGGSWRKEDVTRETDCGGGTEYVMKNHYVVFASYSGNSSIRKRLTGPGVDS